MSTGGTHVSHREEITEEIERIDAAIAGHYRRLQALGDDRALAVARLVKAEEDFRVAHGSPARGAAATVASNMGVAPQQVSKAVSRAKQIKQRSRADHPE